MKQLTIISAAAILFLGACETSVQSTSGADYLARYNSSYDVADASSAEVDADVRRIAALEPNLIFPARIGLARFERGKLTAIPEGEAHIWQDAVADLGAGFGEFVPVNPLIAALVEEKPKAGTNPAAAVVGHIRRGAARQHLDYVLVYEVGTSRSSKANAWSVADLTIVGMFVLPSRTIEVEAMASGLMLDVRNGYPYASMTTYAEKSGTGRAVSQRSLKIDYSHTAAERAVETLADEFALALSELRLRAAETTSGG